MRPGSESWQTWSGSTDATDPGYLGDVDVVRVVLGGSHHERDAFVELDAGQRGDAHVEEDAEEDGERDVAQDVGHHDGHAWSDAGESHDHTARTPGRFAELSLIILGYSSLKVEPPANKNSLSLKITFLPQ